MPAPIEGAWLDAFFDALPGRHTAGHFGLPLQGCRFDLDGQVVVRDGRLL